MFEYIWRNKYNPFSCPLCGGYKNPLAKWCFSCKIEYMQLLQGLKESVENVLEAGIEKYLTQPKE